MSIVHVNEENFRENISNDKVLVDFFATWCGPCKMLSPVLEEIKGDRSELKIVKVDVDESPMLAKEYGVMSVPTLLLFENGELKKRQSGFMPKEMLNNWIED